jgi:hypothetical protein
MDFGVVLSSAFITAIAFVALIYYFMTQADSDEE